MSEISEFEKQLNPGLSFDKHIEGLTLQLARHFDEHNDRNFLDRWDAWVVCWPKDVLNLDLVLNVWTKYLRRADVPDDDLPDYNYLLWASGVYAAAAQRAHHRDDLGTAWDLLIRANQYFNKVSAIQNDLFRLEQKVARSNRALSNGDVPGQRVRYKIIALLHRDRDRQKSPVLFKSVRLAVEKIDNDIANFIDDNKLQISHAKLVSTVKLWIRDHPAFRAEIAPFFADGVIEN